MVGISMCGFVSQTYFLFNELVSAREMYLIVRGGLCSKEFKESEPRKKKRPPFKGFHAFMGISLVVTRLKLNSALTTVMLGKTSTVFITEIVCGFAFICE